MEETSHNGTRWSHFLHLLFGRPPSSFDVVEARSWMDKNWTMSLYASVLYILLIFVGQNVFMKNRPGMSLKGVLTLWNFGQAIFSAMVVFHIWPEFWHRLLTLGFTHSVCGHALEFSKQVHFWGWLFVLSKLADFGDTVFLVLRKRRVIHLHWYHHVTALVMGFYGGRELVSVFAWFGSMNSLVHSLMYTYYGLMSMGVRIPKPIAMTLTLLQLFQMATALGVILYAYQMKSTNQECHTSYDYLNISLLVALSYLLLFGNYFYTSYITKKVKKMA